MRFAYHSFVWSASLISVFVASIVATSVARAADPVTIPFELSPAGHVIVAVRIGDSDPARFIVDTAAGSGVIEPAAADHLGLERTGTTARLRGELGDSEQDTVVLDRLTVGDRSRDGITALVQDLSHVERGRFECDGILGASFLRQFDVRFDYNKHELTLYDAASRATDCEVCPEGATPVPFDIHEQGHILVPAAVGDTGMTGLLDTGSGHSGINSLAADALGLELPEPAPDRAGYGHGLAIQGGPITVGEVVLQESAQLAIVDRDDIFEAFGLAAKPRVLMGSNLFEGRVLSISYGTGTLYVE